VWMGFIYKVINAICDFNPKTIFCLWGKDSHKVQKLTNGKGRFLTAAHPSPFSANRGFFGCQHFKTVNDLFLNDQGIIINKLLNQLDLIIDTNLVNEIHEILLKINSNNKDRELINQRIKSESNLEEIEKLQTNQSKLYNTNGVLLSDLRNLILQCGNNPSLLKDPKLALDLKGPINWQV